MLFTLVLLASTQLAKHFWPSFAYIWGLRIDYLSPTIYLSELVLLLFLLINLKLLRDFLKGRRLVCLFVIFFILLNSFLAVSPLAALFKWVKIVELVMLVVVISKTKIKPKPAVFLPLTISAFVVSVIALGQFLKGANLGGLFYFLGERNFSLVSTGVSLVNIFGRDYLRPYSIFSHPNSLAGYLLVTLCLVLKRKKIFLFSPIFLAFVLTFSRGAWLAALILLLFLALSKINFRTFKRFVFWLFFFLLALSLFSPVLAKVDLFVSGGSRIYERVYLLEVAKRVIFKNPLVGVGLNNFLFELRLPTAWLVQPVHNLFLLIASETGVIGLVAAVVLLVKSLKRNLEQKRIFLVLALMAIVLTGVVDHYWFTLWQNMLLAALVFGLTFRKSLS